MTLPQRVVGLALVLFVLFPVHRLLDPAQTGPAGAATRDAAEAAWVLGLSGSLIVLTLAWVAMRMQPGVGRSVRILEQVWRAVLRPTPEAFATATGVLAFVGSGIIAHRVHGLAPTTVDEMVQLLHAALLTGGSLTLPTGEAAAAWLIQNGVMTEAGWASIYPPFHTILLALGLTAGVPWLMGPLMTAIATGASTWVIERVAGVENGRLAGLLLCVSPFWLLLGATYLSHTTATASLALLAASCIASRDASTRSSAMLWALAAGAAAGGAVSSRPWVGLVCGTTLIAVVWGAEFMKRQDTPGWVSRLAGLLLGGTPFAALLFWWNSLLFGHPLRLGYSAAFGPAHSLGFHVDPWGNRYGVLEALGYTGADLLQLGVRLIESPLPVTLLVAGALLFAPRQMRGRLQLPGLWAASVIVANALYWHHGIHFGPRMTYESIPGWMGLIAIASTTAFKAGDGSGPRFARWAVGMTLTAGLVLGISTLTSAMSPKSSHLSQDLEIPAGRQGGPRVGATGKTIIFVHGSWASRVSAQLAASGMRRDSIETALRRNDLCEVDRYARWRVTPNGTPPSLDFDSRPGSPSHLKVQLLSPGNRIRVSPSVSPDARCRREARSDRLGVLELEVVAWRAPALPEANIVYARDLGPGANLRLLGDSGNEAVVWIDREGAEPLFMPYREGMQLLWGGPGD